ncbi:SRPBCC family protein [Streptomyces sp. NPDC057694]|uniref:SRPBCC family protein n=1 Tax=Streptomyces sp. NPDC057694 TaxID=3346216 RepID=UPI0036A0D395
MTATIPTTPADPSAPTPAPRRGLLRRHRVLASLCTLGVALAGYTAWSNTRPVNLSASIEIEATPAEVWQVLADFPSYGKWNPFITSSEVTSEGGRLEKGAKLRNVMHDSSGDTTFEPEVLTATPGHELRWIGKMGPGWIADGEHRFLIEETGPNRVRLTQTERFTGVAVPFFEGKLKADTLPQFHAMNKAVARRAEALGA